jgi:predicted DNA-binding transcriptional regulator YafY
MSASSPLLRQWQLLQLLSRSQQGVGVVELAEWMQLSVRSVRRDLRLLQTAGFAVEEIVGYRGAKKWRMPPLGNVPPFQLTELLSLYVAGQFLEPLAGTPFWTGL